MDWVWITLLTWLAFALPVAVIAGRYLRRFDAQDTACDADRAAGASVPPAGLPRPRSASARRADRRRRSTSLPRAVHPPLPAGRDVPTQDRETEQDSADEGSTSRTSAGSRRRSPLHRHL